MDLQDNNKSTAICYEFLFSSSTKKKLKLFRNQSWNGNERMSQFNKKQFPMFIYCYLPFFFLLFKLLLNKIYNKFFRLCFTLHFSFFAAVTVLLTFPYAKLSMGVTLELTMNREKQLFLSINLLQNFIEFHLTELIEFLWYESLGL